MNRVIFLITIAVSISAFAQSHEVAKEQRTYPLDATFTEAKQGPYSSKVALLFRNWPMKDAPDLKERANPFWMKGIKTPDQKLYVGVIKQVWIDAPVEKVASLIEDFESYPNLFQDVKTVKVLEKEGNKFLVFWERRTPVFFVPNVKFQQIYVTERPSPNRVLYRYQLKESNALKNSDGAIVLETDGKGTRQTGLDFYNAEWGVLGAVGGGKIWQESLEGTYLGDFSLKFKAEHPDWSREQIAKSAREMLKRFPVEPIQYVEKLPWEESARPTK